MNCPICGYDNYTQNKDIFVYFKINNYTTDTHLESNSSVNYFKISCIYDLKIISEMIIDDYIRNDDRFSEKDCITCTITNWKRFE